MRQLHDVVADNVRRLRTERGWSQAQLAHAMRTQGLRSWSPSTVALVETGKQRADRLLDLAALCGVFGVPLAELVAGEDAIDLYADETADLATIRDCLAGGSGGVDTETLSTDDPFDLVRIARRVGLTRNELIFACYDLLGRWDFIGLREEWAHIDPGTTARTAQAKRGHATRKILDLVQGHVVTDGMTAIRGRALPKLRAEIRKNPQLRADLESRGIDLRNTARKEMP